MAEHTDTLRVLVADGGEDRLQQIAETVAGLGHEAIKEVERDRVGPATAAHRADVAIVVVSDSSDQTLGYIGKIVREAACPVIALLEVQDREFINEASKQGIFAYLTGGRDPAELQSSIDIVLRRFAEYHALEGAFGRRAVMERAKGILMERHGIDEKAAFDLLRAESRRHGRKVVDTAEAVLESHRLLPRRPVDEAR
jgi:AmiR/NasT family two-component response regulator